MGLETPIKSWVGMVVRILKRGRSRRLRNTRKKLGLRGHIEF